MADHMDNRVTLIQAMDKAAAFGEALQIMMCKYDEMLPGTIVCAYLADQLLVDTGPSYTAETLADFLAENNLK